MSFFSFENHKDIWELINELIYIKKRLGKRMNEKEIKLMFQSQSKIIFSLTRDCVP